MTDFFNLPREALIARLIEYESTGLTPTEIVRLRVFAELNDKRLKDNVKDNVDRCVCCGEVIPEGRQVCPKCEGKYR